MYSKPRAATVTAAKDGVLWAMDRRSFRAILMKSSTTSLVRTLRSVDVLKSMTVGQLQRLQDVLTEVTFADGDFVIQQGEHSETFYVIVEGRVRCTKREHPADAEIELMQLGDQLTLALTLALTLTLTLAEIELMQLGEGQHLEPFP